MVISNDIATKIRNLEPFSRTRFAPSPTGYLHLGHVLSACYVWLIARLKGAEVLLRIEDHDLVRCREEYVQGIYDDLLQLGFEADLGPDPSLGCYRQSEHRERYAKAISSLRTYFCSCTRKKIFSRVSKDRNNILLGAKDRSLNSRLGSNQSEASDLSYDGYCRGRNLREGAVRLHCDELPRNFHDFYAHVDILASHQNISDILLQERNGNYSYHFCVAVDDYLEGIDFVIRGQDLLQSTCSQLVLHEMLGNKNPPRFFHHPLLLDEQGRKLSKRFFSESVRSMMQQGMESADILGLACGLGGLWPAGQRVTLPQLIDYYQKRDPQE